MGKKGVFSEFMISDVQLGLFESEVCNYNNLNSIKILEFNKLDLILKLNDKLIAN
jgi:hypothetical protein